MAEWMKDGKFTALDENQVKELDGAQLGAYTAAKNEHFVSESIAKVSTQFDEKLKGFMSADEIAKVKADFAEGLKALPVDALKTYEDTIKELKEGTKKAEDAEKELRAIVKTQGLEIKANKEHAIPDIRRKASREDQIKQLIVHGLASSEFKAFEGRGFNGASNKMSLAQKDGKIELQDVATKATVGVSADHTGNVMISEVSNIVTDDAPTRMSHVRDILNVSMTDQAQIVAGQVYDWTDALTLGATMLAENGQSAESVFKSKENTWGIKRIANSFRISKREIRTNGLKWVMDKVLAKAPNATLFVEDRQLLFGDGEGNNIQGLAGKAQSFDLTPNTYAAGAISSVASYNSGAQALITFAAAHGIKNGDNLIIANATEGTYNDTHESVEVVNATQVVIDLTYVLEADTAAWTGSNTSPFYQTIENAQEYDTLAVSDALLESDEFACAGYIIHPSQATQIGLLKDTLGNYLNIPKDGAGKISGINGKPVIATTAMPYGKFLSGDFTRNGAELKEFTPLNIQFVEDVESVKKNEIVMVIEEEIIFPVYNPYWFIFGKFSTAKTQLETA